MPYRRKYKKPSRRSYRKRRNYRRRTYRRRNPRTMVSMRNPFAQSALIKHRYVATDSIDPAAGSPAYLYIRANGMYDPDASGVGHQPLGFDQWGTFYNKFTVLGAKCTVKFISGTETTDEDYTNHYTVGIIMRDTSDALGSITDTMEHSNGRFTIVPAGQTRTLSLKFSTKRYYGIKGSITGNNQYTGTAAADPTEQAYFAIWAAPVTEGAVDNPSMYVQIIVEYIALWFDPKDIESS